MQHVECLVININGNLRKFEVLFENRKSDRFQFVQTSLFWPKTQEWQNHHFLRPQTHQILSPKWHFWSPGIPLSGPPKPRFLDPKTSLFKPKRHFFSHKTPLSGPQNTTFWYQTQLSMSTIAVSYQTLFLSPKQHSPAERHHFLNPKMTFTKRKFGVLVENVKKTTCFASWRIMLHSKQHINPHDRKLSVNFTCVLKDFRKDDDRFYLHQTTEKEFFWQEYGHLSSMETLTLFTELHWPLQWTLIGTAFDKKITCFGTKIESIKSCGVFWTAFYSKWLKIKLRSLKFSWCNPLLSAKSKSAQDMLYTTYVITYYFPANWLEGEDLYFKRAIQWWVWVDQKMHRAEVSPPWSGF